MAAKEISITAPASTTPGEASIIDPTSETKLTTAGATLVEVATAAHVTSFLELKEEEAKGREVKQCLNIADVPTLKILYGRVDFKMFSDVTTLARLNCKDTSAELLFLQGIMRVPTYLKIRASANKN